MSMLADGNVLMGCVLKLKILKYLVLIFELGFQDCSVKKSIDD